MGKKLRYTHTLQIDLESLWKLRYIAEHNGHSINEEIKQYIKKYLKEFEEKNGKIDLTEDA